MSPFTLLRRLPRRGARHLMDFLVARSGGVRVAAPTYARLQATRTAALTQLVALEAAGADLAPGLSGIVFSKDRALQVHGLLTSYFALVKHPAPLTVLYHAGTPAHATAYAELARLFAKAPAPVTFLRETRPFREMLLALLAATPTRNVFFLVDDIVFIRPLDLGLAARIDPLAQMLCLRLSPSITTSDMVHNRSRQPRFHRRQPPTGTGAAGEPLLSFSWQEGTNDWDYPYSVDGNIFSTAEMRVLARLGSFKAPNTFEVALMGFAELAQTRPGVCYAESKLVNLPINLVQTEITTNNAGTTTPDSLLAAWQQGQTFDTTVLRRFVPTSPHENLVLPLVARAGQPAPARSPHPKPLKKK